MGSETDRQIGRVDREGKATRKIGKKNRGREKSSEDQFVYLDDRALTKDTFAEGCRPLAWQ